LQGEKKSYLGRRNGPDLEVVGTHEDISDTLAHLAQDPLVKVLGLGVGYTGGQGSVDDAINTLDLVLLGQHGDVVLERVGDPEALITDVGDTLVCVPVIILGQSLVQAVVKVFVVGEDNVTTDVVQLGHLFSKELYSGR
jgi:hypothetical protein